MDPRDLFSREIAGLSLTPKVYRSYASKLSCNCSKNHIFFHLECVALTKFRSQPFATPKKIQHSRQLILSASQGIDQSHPEGQTATDAS